MDLNAAPKTDQKLSVTFEVKKGDNKYSFTMPYQCPLGEAYDAVYEVLADVVQMSQRSFENAKQQESLEKVEKNPEDPKK